jgi:hypothetical protein
MRIISHKERRRNHAFFRCCIVILIYNQAFGFNVINIFKKTSYYTDNVVIEVPSKDALLYIILKRAKPWALWTSFSRAKSENRYCRLGDERPLCFTAESPGVTTQINLLILSSTKISANM